MAKSESVDEEILQHFQHLSDLQKQAVLAIVRAFAVKQQDTTEFREKLIEKEEGNISKVTASQTAGRT